MSEMYDESYYLRGKETGKSLYENYHWMPDLTIPMVRAIIEHTGITCDDRILDFGCARGYIVKAFQEMGYYACGVDTSKWAIDNCDPEVRGLVSDAYQDEVDWIIAKDVLEHVSEVSGTIRNLMRHAGKGVFAVVPLASVDRDYYVVPNYELDVTHVHRLTLTTWAGMFMRSGWSVEARYRIKGVKDNYAEWKNGNGFLTCRRLPE